MSKVKVAPSILSADFAKMAEAVGIADLEKIVHLLESACTNTIFNWDTELAFFTVTALQQDCSASSR